MPTYEYECSVCGHFEATQKMSDKPLKQKPGCDNKKCPKKAQRLISGGTFHLKGGGWYKDGYGSAKANSSGETAPASTDTKKKADSGGGSGGSSGGCGGGCSCH